jgi:hypothetical protein
MTAATTCGVLGACILVAASGSALAGTYWDGDRGPPEPPAYQRPDCPPPPCQPCWRGGESYRQDGYQPEGYQQEGYQQEGYQQEGWSDEAPPEDEVGPPDAGFVEGGVGADVIEGGGGGGGFVGGGGFQPGLAIAAQFDFGGNARAFADVHAHAYAHASAHAYAHSYSHVSYGHSMSYQRQGYQPHMSYGGMRYGPMSAWGQSGMGSGWSGRGMGYHPAMAAHGYRRR